MKSLSLLAAMLTVSCLAFPATAQLPAPTPTDVVAVRLVVRGPARASLPSAYVALVPPERPAWRPLTEAIAAQGAATLYVPRGLYQVFVASPGFQDAWRSVQIKSSTTLTFDLLHSAPVSGVLVDASGKPVSGAAVTNLRVTGPVELGQSSPMARQYFASEWATHTAADGTWQLPGRDDASIPVIFEAAGYAPAAEFRRSRESPVKVTTLSPGAALTVTLDRADPDIFLTLQRDGNSGGDPFAALDPVTLTRSAGSKSVTWTSLKPGTYTVLAEYLDPRHFADLHPLGNIMLTAGQHGELRLVLPVSTPRAVDFIAAFIPGRPSDDLETLHALRSTRYGDEPLRAAFLRTSGGTLVYVKTNAAASDVRLVTNDAIYIPDRRATVGTDICYSIARSARADLSVTFAAPATAPLPRYARAEFARCTFASPHLAFVAPISPGGKLEMSYPAACRSVLMHMPPFEPAAFEESLGVHEKKVEGPYALKLGGSAEVHVRRDPSGAASPGALVRVFITDPETRQLLVTQAPADGSGNVLLAGLPTGRDVTIQAQDATSEISGSASTRVLAGEVAPVEVTIPQPGAVSIAPRLSREFRAAFPEAQIQSVAIEPDGSTDQSLRRNADLTAVDHALFQNVRPGLWHVLVLVEAAGALQPLPAGDVSIRAGDTQQLEPEITPAIFPGYVLRAGVGFPAQIGFGDPPSTHSVTRFVRSDQQGHFTALLPVPGIYRVTVTPVDRPNAQVSLGEVDFSDSSRPVTLTIPPGAVNVAVKERGEPVPNATVAATLTRTTAYGTMSQTVQQATTDIHGQTHLAGLLPGRWLLEAESSPGGSRAEAPLMIVASTSEPSAVELNLQRPSALKGTVQRANNMIVPSAALDCLFTGPSGVPQTAHAESDPAGHFAIDLPAPPPSVLHCGVTTVAGEVAAFVLGPSESADFLLPSQAGSIVIPDFGPHATRDGFWLVAPDGRLFNLGWAQAKLSPYWSPLSLARVPVGEWTLVNATNAEAWLRLATTGGNALEPYASIRVEPGKSTTIHLQEERDANSGDPKNMEVTH